MRVWAPSARRVDLIVEGARIAMQADGDGGWLGPDVSTGTRYALSLDGGPPRPDPRSRSQPDGVHGASEQIDVEHPVDAVSIPLRDAVIYELHVGTFTEAGTFASAVARLDDLVALGITHVELMPVAQWSGHHGWGYDGVDLFAPHAPYGGPAGLRTLIAACHRRGLAVIVDTVLNHFGPEGAHLREFGPYTTDRHRTPWGEAVNLDGHGSAEVRRFLVDAALTWLRDYGADGLRLDAVHAFRDDSERHFIGELGDAVRALDRPAFVIGEYDDHDPAALTEWGLDAHWNDDFHHAIHVLVTGERTGYYADFAAPGTLARVLANGYALDGRHSPFRGAPHGKPFGALPRDRLVAYVQSHDQIGNRAAGERLHVLAGDRRAMIAAAILFVSPFVPMVFQGEEWAASTPFCYFAQPESVQLREAIRRGRRAEHALDGDLIDPIDPATRDRCVLRWAERGDEPHARMLAWYRALISARRTHAALRDPDPASTQVEQAGDVLVIRRGELALACNLSEQAQPAPRGEVVLASAALARATELPPLSCALIQI